MESWAVYDPARLIDNAEVSAAGMTLRGHHPMDKRLLRLIGLMMEVRALTHPERVAKRYGISAEYVRKQWRYLAPEQLVSQEVLARHLERLLPAIADAASFANTFDEETAHDPKRNGKTDGSDAQAYPLKRLCGA